MSLLCIPTLLLTCPAYPLPYPRLCAFSGACFLDFFFLFCLFFCSPWAALNMHFQSQFILTIDQDRNYFRPSCFDLFNSSKAFMLLTLLLTSHPDFSVTETWQPFILYSVLLLFVCAFECVFLSYPSNAVYCSCFLHFCLHESECVLYVLVCVLWCVLLAS